MFALLRKTDRRGLSGVPLRRLRRRWWRRIRRCRNALVCDATLSSSWASGLPAALPCLLTDLAGLSGLAPNHFVLVPDTLAEVGLGRPDRSHFGCDLAHELFVHAGDLDARRGRHVESNA